MDKSHSVQWALRESVDGTSVKNPLQHWVASLCVTYEKQYHHPSDMLHHRERGPWALERRDKGSQGMGK